MSAALLQGGVTEADLSSFFATLDVAARAPGTTSGVTQASTVRFVISNLASWTLHVEPGGPGSCTADDPAEPAAAAECTLTCEKNVLLDLANGSHLLGPSIVADSSETFAVYQLECFERDSRWTVVRRWSELRTFSQQLSRLRTGDGHVPALPRSLDFAASLEPAFLAKRAAHISDYLTEALAALPTSVLLGRGAPPLILFLSPDEVSEPSVEPLRAAPRPRACLVATACRRRRPRFRRDASARLRDQRGGSDRDTHIDGGRRQRCSMGVALAAIACAVQPLRRGHSLAARRHAAHRRRVRVAQRRGERERGERGCPSVAPAPACLRRGARWFTL